MTPIDLLLARVQAAGGTLEPWGDRLKVRAPAPLPDDLLAELRAHKGELLTLLRGELPAALSDWSEDWRERFEERAAIMEYDGGLSRPEAERRAETLVREAHRRAQERHP